MRILVTGAGGFIGGRFCALAFQSGHEVFALVRSRPGRSVFPQATRHFYGELPYDLPSAAFENIDAMVHCAAVLKSDQAGQSDAVNLEGTRTLLEMVRRYSPAARFVFLSTQSVHGKSQSPYARTKRDGEALVKSSGVSYTLIRPGLVYGPGDAGLFARMRSMIVNMPMLPLLGGGKALVQPVHVDDLSLAMLNSLALTHAANSEFNIGDSAGIPLREFLQQVARAETGKKKLALGVPLAPVKLVTRIAEKLRLPFPINSDNLQGLENVARMDTEDSHRSLGVSLRPLNEGLSQRSSPSSPMGLGAMPVRVLLVGAGKIGIVHALNLIKREGAILAGIVDPSPKSARLYKSMGFGVCHETLNEGIRAAYPDAVIVATPASTHLEITEECCRRGISVLVEKPLAVNAQQLVKYEELRRQYAYGTILTGYMAAQYPHLDDVKEILASGRLGKILSFDAVVLQTHIVATKPVRWEMVRAKSGGGVIINYAGHAISILRRLMPELHVDEAATWPIYSVDVEDAAILRLIADDVPGWMLTTWSIPGYARPSMRITFHCEQGNVILENAFAAVEVFGEISWLRTQRDYPVGYNAAPDYTGAGFSREHENFSRYVKDSDHLQSQAESAPSRRPVEVAEAIVIERWIQDMYARFPLESTPRIPDRMPQDFHKFIELLPAGAR